MTTNMFTLVPEQATEYAKQVDALYFYIGGLSLVLTVLFIVLLVWFTIRYRRPTPG